MFQLATREWNLLEKNPPARIIKFSDQAPNGGYQVPIFTRQELQTALTSTTPEWRPIFAINAFTGLRCAEVERLDWSERSNYRRLIDLPYTKPKNGRPEAASDSE